MLLAEHETLGTLGSNDGDGDENVKKNSRFHSQYNNFARARPFFTLLCPFLHDYDLKMPNFTFYGVRKQVRTKFYFFSLNLDMVPRNSTTGGFA